MRAMRNNLIRLAGLALIVVALIGAACTRSDAVSRWEHKDKADHGVQLRQPQIEVIGYKDRVVWAEHVTGRWYALDLTDGSRWYMSECEYDEINGDRRQMCYWNAHTMGNCDGTSFAVVNGHAHAVTRYAQQHDGSTCTTPGAPEAEGHPMCDPPLPPHYMRTRS